MKRIINKHVPWLPTSQQEVERLGWNELDVVLFSGDAYIDHPACGVAVIGRILEKEGLRIAIVPQPNWRDDLRDFRKLGKPRLFFGVTSGSMDSMINHYTASLRKRSDDVFTVGGTAGQRPDYAVTVYTKILKQLYPEVPVVIGGIEASLRRLTHYDYWSNSLMPSVLISSGADLLIYGMAEKPIQELVGLLGQGVPFHSLTNIRQTVYLSESDTFKDQSNWQIRYLHSYEMCKESRKKFAENFKLIEEESNIKSQSRLLEKYDHLWVVVNPPVNEYTQEEIDEPYQLPYMRLPHPRYELKGQIPAFEMIRNSINIHRGCFGGCSFCTLSVHQGKFIRSRSEASILKEVDQVVSMPDFKGHITDLGGPSANMYNMKGKNLQQCDLCKRHSCIFPSICKNLDTNHSSLSALYRKVRIKPLVKKVSIGSGVRYDLLVNEESKDKLTYLNELIRFHVSGRLKVAPEHISDSILKLMRKPSFHQFKKLKLKFDKQNKQENLNQQLIPYFISSHPGSTIKSMAELAVEIKNLDLRPEQVQDFTPTPMTLSSVIYYTGINPYTMEKVFVARNVKEKELQKKFFFWYKKENQSLLKKVLQKKGEHELVKKLFDEFPSKKVFRKAR